MTLDAMSDFKVDIGRADKGRTFICVVHLSTGKERIVVGSGDSNPDMIAQQVARELLADLAVR